MLFLLIFTVIALVVVTALLVGQSRKILQLTFYHGQYQQLQQEAKFLHEEKARLVEKVDELQQVNLEFEKTNELLMQAERDLKKKQEEWNKDKETILLKLSEELLSKNQQQQGQIVGNLQETNKKIVEDLAKNFAAITAKVTALDDGVKKASEAINITHNALLTPGGAGRSSEITLENILKISNLRQKDNFQSSGDYILQSHFSGYGVEGLESKRPDAILFLPDNQIAIIDSKSSPHFIELEQARESNDTVGEKEILIKIRDSMRRHVESLKKREYAKFLFEELRKNNAISDDKNFADYKICIIMFLQTEKMLEIVRQADEGLEIKAWESGIFMVSPIGLINFLSQARFVIDRFKQENNVGALKVEVIKLLENVVRAFEESAKVGRALHRANESYNGLTKIFNRNIAKVAKNITEMGISNQKIEANLKLLEEVQNDESSFVEAENLN